MLLQLYFIASVIIITNILQTRTKGSEMQAIKANFQCHCGKVKGIIDSPSALRIVCYCKDCRGYYLTLNNLATKLGLPAEPAKLDQFGGSDFTQIYPSEISISEGKDKLERCIIREKSPIHRTYAKCC